MSRRRLLCPPDVARVSLQLSGGRAVRQGGEMLRSVVIGLALLATAVPAAAQTTDGEYYDSLSPSMAATVKAMYATIRRDLLDAAQSMPAEEYGFKPTPEVRSFAEIVSHVATANAFFCAQ